MQQLDDLTETAWYSPRYTLLQHRLRDSSERVVLDFSKTRWFDLWPLSQLAKLLFQRLVTDKRKVLIEIPYSRQFRTVADKFKALCFLVDIGFLGRAVEWGAVCQVNGAPIVLEHTQDAPSGLSSESLERLEPYGYLRKEYKDKILVPLTVVDDSEDVEAVKRTLQEYVKTSVEYYERQIAEGSFIDIFFRELAENSVEHASGSRGFVVARLVRSLWDLSAKQRKSVQGRRNRGKLAPMKYFLKRYENEGYLELIVVDDGPGIYGTLPADEAVRRSAMGIFRFAMRPDVSRFDPETRQGKGKSPLTGLGECASCLEHLSGVLAFRESHGGAYCCPSTAEKSLDLVKLDFKALRRRPKEGTKGCNIQVALAVAPRSLKGEPVAIGSQVPVSFSFRSLFSGDSSRSDSVRSVTEFREFTSSDIALKSRQVVDLTGASADKDTAWHIVQRILEIQGENERSIVLVGLTRQLASRMNDALNKSRDHLKARLNSDHPFGWLGMTADLQILFVGGTPALSDFVRKGMSRGSFPLTPDLHRKVVQEELRLCDRGGRAVSVDDIFWSWQLGVSGRIQADPTFHRHVISNLNVELPNGDIAGQCLDLYELARNPRIRRLLVGGAQREIARVRPAVVVTYSALARRLCSEALRTHFPEIAQVDLPTPYAVPSTIESLTHYRLRRALVFADVVNTGSHISRVVRGCETVGIGIDSAFALLDSHPEDREPKCGVPYTAIIQCPSHMAAPGSAATHRVDPYTLAIEKVGETFGSQLPSPRSKGETRDFYGFVSRQKAIIDQHSCNEAGHHFVVAIDFRQIVRADAVNYLVQRMQDFARGCRALIVPSESVIASVAEEIGEKLGLDSENVLWAIEGRRIVKEHRLSASDQSRLHRIAVAGGDVLFLDDAIHHGKTLADIARHAAQCSLPRLRAWFILDNRPPGSSSIIRIADSGGTLEIRQGALLRSFFPAFESPLSCPYCKIAAAYHASLRSHPNALIEEQINVRLSEIRPIDIKTVVLDPWRHFSTEAVQLPQLRGLDSILESASSAETLNVALWELSQYEEGILAILDVFKERRLHQQDGLLALILSKNITTLEKLRKKTEYLRTFREVVRDWKEEDGPSIFETALLWPREVLAEEIPNFIEDLNQTPLSSDSFLATLHALVNRTLRNCRPQDRTRILQSMEAVQRRTPKDVSYGILHSVFSSFTQQADPNKEFCWALTALAKRLLIHREPWHRIQERIPNLAATLTPSHALEILGMDDSVTSIETFGIFYYIAELGQAVQTLARIGELKTGGNVDHLLEAIQKVMLERAMLRERWQQHQRLPNPDEVQKSIEQISAGLLRISDLLTSSDPENRVVELYSVLENRIVKPSKPFLTDLYDELKKNPQRLPVQLDDDFESKIQNVYIVADPLLLTSVIKSLTTNVARHTTRINLLSGIVLGGEVGTDGTCSVHVSNPCKDVDAERKFYRGPDYHSISAALHRFSARYTGNLRENLFVMKVHFTTVI